MGDAADMMLEGFVCQFCGEWMGADEGPGYPVTCDGCKERDEGEETHGH